MLKKSLKCPQCGELHKSMPITETLTTGGTLYSDEEASWGESTESFVVSCPECDWSQEFATIKTAIVILSQ